MLDSTGISVLILSYLREFSCNPCVLPILNQDIVEHINMANDFEDRMIANHQKPDPALQM